MNRAALRRIWGLVYRHLALYRRSWPRLLELAYWPVLVLFFAGLMMMGWAVALGVTALILRHGAGAEPLAWSVLFGLTPFAAVFYPVAILPAWLQPVAWMIPAAHVFEGMREALLHGTIAWGHLAAAFALDLFWLVVMGWLFLRQFEGARVRGALLNIGE